MRKGRPYFESSVITFYRHIHETKLSFSLIAIMQYTSYDMI